MSPNGLRILLQLRAQGYYNPKDGCKRGDIDIDIDIEQSELAALISISTKTIQRAFAEDEVLCKYVQRVFQVKRDKFGRILKEHYVYVVVMDDVLTPEDQGRYQVMLGWVHGTSFTPKSGYRSVRWIALKNKVVCVAGTCAVSEGMHYI